MDDFPFIKMAAVHHLRFLKVKISTSGPVRGRNMRHYAKICEDRSNRSRDMADFRFLRLRPSAILDLFYAFWDHPRRVFGGPCDCAKFGCNRRSNFDSMRVKLENAYSRPKKGFCGILPPKWRAIWTRPKKAHPWAESRRMTYRSSKSVHACALGASRRIK